jgi:hypothetical protein
MFDKRVVHHIWTRIRPFKPWYFLVLAALSGIICVAALRSNNLNMIKLRDAVYQADKQNGDVEGAQRNLRVYIYGHMNTALASGPNAVHPPIQLKYMYDRLVAAEQTRVKDYNAAIYPAAQKYCEAKIPTGFSGRYRISCIDDYVKSHGTTPRAIPKNLYQFDFMSPKWSPDLAGWSLVITVLLAVCGLGSWLADKLFRRDLHHHA